MFPIDAIYIDEPNKINGDNYVGGKVDPVKEDECSGGYDCKPTGDYEKTLLCQTTQAKYLKNVMFQQKIPAKKTTTLLLN